MQPLLLKLKEYPYLPSKKKKVKQLPAFLNRLSTLLNEGYTFADSIDMLLPYHVENLVYWRAIIYEKLKNGGKVIDILKSFPIPNHYLITLQIAEESGNIAEVLKTVSKQLEFTYQMRKKVVKLLSYPIFLSVVLMMIFIAFRTYFLPSITEIIRSRSKEVSGMVSISNLFLHLPDILFIISSSCFILFLIFFVHLKRKAISERINILLKLPVVNYFFKLQLTIRISKTLGELLVSGISLQQALDILQNQQLNQTIAYVARELERQVIYGELLSNAVSILAWFSPKFEEFIKHGEKSGYLGRELLIYCDLLEEKLQTNIQFIIAIVQPCFFILIAVCIIAAYLSILLPMYELIELI
ncbi:competence type IV pilus assembly protein ComGB [Ureibacillus sp. 179-F W5.1 NHS]|uniref:Type II secretion system F family protein n=1 Tax=Lysinibacillus halotolerans TaxID=1368476 RepID=A0A3M8HAX1_9BACI|nr:competence type IV pilus assembly protein ComGB [Lysinibacillus halotolerans]RNC99220.1 type II secretion system F family protein [Lysinibacillus halotolerans]